MRKRTVDLEEGGFVQTSASRSIPHFLKAGECTGHVLTWFCGGGLFFGVLEGFFAFSEEACFFLILCFLISSTESPVSSVCILFHFFPHEIFR